MKNLLRKLRRAVHEARGLDVRLPIEARLPTQFLGSVYGGWTITRVGLPESPTVFSVGLGCDITFDRAVIEALGARVVGFDPTPKSRRYIESQSLPAAFTYVPQGLAAYDGTATFQLPRSGDDSYSTDAAATPGQAADTVDCAVRRLATLAADQGLSAIDVLKVDIEGGEYDALPDALAGGVRVGQLLVELHYDQSAAQLERARRLLGQVRDAGFKLYARSPVGRELSFIHRDRL